MIHQDFYPSFQKLIGPNYGLAAGLFETELLISSDKRIYIAGVQGRDIPSIPISAAFDKHICLEKALSEFIERRTLWTLAEKTLNSSGFSAHISLDQAKTSAALEILERHSILLHWRTRKSFSKIKSPSDGNAALLKKHLENLNIQVDIGLGINPLNLPVVCCRLTHAHKTFKQYCSFGSAARFTIEEALTAALLESVAVWKANENLLQSGIRPGQMEEIRTLQDSQLYALYNYTAENSDFLFSKSFHVPTAPFYSSIEDAYAHNKIHLKFIEFPSRLAQEHKRHVVLALSHDLIPLNSSYSAGLSHYDFIQKWIHVQIDDFNHFPHPYP